MKNKYTVIYFGNDWFAKNKTSSHHIANRLSNYVELVYVECPGLRTPRASGRDLKRIFIKLGNIFSKPRVSENGFSVYTMFQLPFHKWKIVALANKILAYRFINSIRNKCSSKNIVFWFHVPHVGYLAKKFESNAIIYYCTDDYASFPGVEFSAIKKMDEYLTKNADIAFLTSKALFNAKKNESKKAIYSPHGVDFSHFNKADEYSGKVPNDILEIRKPIIGFFGLIEYWIDIKLLKYLAEYNLDWNIVLIGHCPSDVSEINSLDNVFFLGQKDYNLLPKYASSFDIAILPYKSSYQIQYCNPLKLKEYLATGKPVVSVDFPEVKEYSHLVSIASNYEEFAVSVENALELKSTDLKKQRIESVRNSTWEHTAENVVNNLREIIDI